MVYGLEIVLICPKCKYKVPMDDPWEGNPNVNPAERLMDFIQEACATHQRDGLCLANRCPSCGQVRV